ncbi:hypothetical protein APHAL10511_000920 [Amanita phalloides]|nr:hypothetical protein APHAL10511_000920 [Amanita phalloides]
MASSCTTIPTLTRTTAVTTQSTSTIVSSSVTTSPPSTTFITSTGTTCYPVSEGSTACQTTTQVTNSTIPGATSTVGITQTTVVPITSSVVNTLYSTSCTVVSSSTSKYGTTSASSSSSSSPSLITVTSMSSSTAANGSVVMTQVTETSTYWPSTSSASTASGITSTTGTTSLNLAPIIGGSVGGFFALSAIVLLGWYFWKRKHNWDNIFAEDPILNDAFPKPKRDPPLDGKPKPYQYGIVGHSAVPPHMSPPPSAGLSLSSDGSNVHPFPHNPPPSQQQSSMQQTQQSAAQQQDQQQSVAQQSQNLVGQQQQSVGSNSGQQAVMQQQQQTAGPSSGPQLPNQQTYPSSSLYSRAITAASVASVSPRPSAISVLSSVQDGSSSLSTISPPGPWVTPGSGRYPPGMQRNLSATVGLQAASHAGAALETGQRQSIIDENEVYGGIAMDTPAAGSSGAVNIPVPVHSYSRPPGMGPGAGLGQDFSEFDPYREQEQQPAARERRDGKGRLVKVAEKPPVVHLDGGRYRAPVISPEPGTRPVSLGNESVMAPPAYSA